MPIYPQHRKFTSVESTWTTGPDSFVTSGVQDRGNLVYTNKRADGLMQPRWKDLIKLHQQAGTPLTGERYEWSGATSGLTEVALRAKPGAFVAHQKITRRYSGDLITPFDIGPFNFYSNGPLEASVVNKNLIGFLNACQEACRKFQSGVFLGEIRDTLRMIKNPAKAINKLIGAYHKDAVKRTKRYVDRARNSRHAWRGDPIIVSDIDKVLADTWLEYSFGLIPLMSDVKSGAEALAELAVRAFDVDLVHFKTRQDADGNLPPSYAHYEKSFNAFAVYGIHQRETCEVSCWTQGQVKVEVTDPRLMRQEVLGWNASEFLPTVWELIPWSFLVDYFSNVGEVIGAWSFPQSKLAWWNRSLRVSRNREITGELVRVANNDVGYQVDHSYGSSINLRLSAVTFRRDNHTLGFPTIMLEVPGSSMKWLNMAALADMRRL